MTNRDQILEALRISSWPLDDDQLSARTGITPRQTVNQICRALEREGLIRRFTGPDMKIVNEQVDKSSSSTATSAGLSPAEPSLAPLAPAESPPGSSAEQREAERIMLGLLGQRLGVALAPTPITVPSGVRVEVDGADPERTVLVECWAHQGPPKGGQKHKVLTDALKLSWIAQTIYPRPRLILCMSDPAATAPFRPAARSWAAQALIDLGIGIEVVELPPDVRRRVLEAQKRQYR